MSDLSANINLENVGAVEDNIKRLQAQVERLNAMMGRLGDVLAAARVSGVEKAIADLESKEKRLSTLRAGREQGLVEAQESKRFAQSLTGGHWSSGAAATFMGDLNRRAPIPAIPDSITELTQRNRDAGSSVIGQHRRAAEQGTVAGYNGPIGNYAGTGARLTEEAKIAQKRGEPVRADALNDLSKMTGEYETRVRAERSIARVFEPARQATGKFFEAFDSLLDAFSDGVEGVSLKQVSKARRDIRMRARVSVKRAEELGGPVVAEQLRGELDKKLAPLDARLPEAQHRDDARKAVETMKGTHDEMRRREDRAKRLRAAGHTHAAEKAELEARKLGAALPELAERADELSAALPHGQERGEMRKTVRNVSRVAERRLKGEESRQSAEEMDKLHTAGLKDNQKVDQAAANSAQKFEDMYTRAFIDNIRFDEKVARAAQVSAQQFEDMYTEAFIKNIRFDEKKVAERQEATSWAQGKVGGIQDKFDAIDDKKKIRDEFRAGGHDDAADSLTREMYRMAIEARKQTDALQRLSRDLVNSSDPRDRKRGTELHDELHHGDKAAMFKGLAGNAMNEHRPQEFSGLGDAIAKGMGRIPVFGEILRYTKLDKGLASSIDKTKFGQAGNGVLKGLSGGELGGEDQQNATIVGGHGLGKAARAAMMTPVGKVVGGAALATGGAFWYGNKRANADMEKTGDARNEEIIYGNLGNKLGTADRLMNDVRETRGRDQNGALNREMRALRMGTEDYVNLAGAYNAPGLDTENRRSSVMTGLKMQRAYGLEAGEVGGVAQAITQGDRMGGNAGNLTRDLNSFAVVLSEGIKRGVGSDETTRAFSSAIERSRASGGGVLEDAQRQGLISQLLSASQSGNAHLSGQLGADFISGANAKTAGAEGKDKSFLLRSLGERAGSELGLSKEDAAQYDKLRASSPIVAAEFAQTKLTPEMQALQTQHTLNSYGSNLETTRTGLRTAFDMDKGSAAVEAQSLQEQLEAARKKSGNEDLQLGDAWAQGLVKTDHLSAISGRDAGRSGEADRDALKETQKDNTGYQTAGTQEIRIQDAKIQAQRITFESESVRRNTDLFQNMGQGVRNTRQDMIGVSNNLYWYGQRQRQNDHKWDENGDPTVSGGDNLDAREGENSRVTGGRNPVGRVSDRGIVKREDSGPTWTERREERQDYGIGDRPVKRAGGGPISGEGGPTSDSILARLSNGEFVINAKQTAKHRRLIEAVNADRLPAFASGGPVGNGSLAADPTGERETRRLSEAMDRLTAQMERRALISGEAGILSARAMGGGEDAPTSKGFFGRLMDGIRGKLFGGERGAATNYQPSGISAATVSAPGDGGQPGSGMLGFEGDAGSGGKIAEQARKALADDSFVSIAGRCSQFVRQVVERANGLAGHALSGSLFADEARQSGELWKKKGWAKTPEEMKEEGQKYRAGDVLFQMSGSGDYDGDGDDGHTGIVSEDGKSVIENSVRGRGGKMVTPIEKWGKIDQVGRYGGWGEAAGKPGAAPIRSAAGPAAGTAGGLDAFIQAISAQESGGDYGAVNKRTGALGRYQIMPQNLTGWGKNAGKKNFGWDYDALGRDVSPEEFKKNPELQDKIAQHRLGELYKQHGAAGAARAWYSNSASPSSRRPAAGEPTPDEYAAQVTGRMGGLRQAAPVKPGGGAGGRSAVPAGSGKVTHEIKVSGAITVNGKVDAQVTRAAANKVAAAIKGSAPRQVPSGSARPGA